MSYACFITSTLQDASEIASKNFGKVTETSKGTDNNQVLTEADIEIGKLIIKRIQETYPDHNIIDEEAGIIDKKSSFTWVIDPIDGTSNFANCIPQYGIAIGLLKQSLPLAGGIALPYFSEIYIAEKQKGTFCGEKKLQVTSETKLLSTLVSHLIDGHQENPDLTRDECSLIAKIVLNIRNLRNSGSLYDAIMVAKGNFGGYLNRTSKIWDNVAAQIIIEEAGGIYTDFLGRPMDYSYPLTKTKSNFTACAAPPALHSQLQQIIHSRIHI